jgi:hypothetical protein
MTEEYLELDAVAAQLGCNKATLLGAIDEGELTAIKGIWRGYRTTQEWVNAWLARKTVNPEAAAAPTSGK